MLNVVPLCACLFAQSACKITYFARIYNAKEVQHAGVMHASSTGAQPLHVY